MASSTAAEALLSAALQAAAPATDAAAASLTSMSGVSITPQAIHLAVGVTASLVAMSSVWGCVCQRRSRKQMPGQSAAEQADAADAANTPASIENMEYCCVACDVVLPAGNDAAAKAKHAEGKKHRARVVSGAPAGFSWRPKAAPAPAPAPAKVAAPASAPVRVAQALSMSLAQEEEAGSGGGGWQVVKGQATHQSSGKPAASSLMVAQFKCQMGGSNILEGLGLIDAYLSEKDKLHSWVAGAIADGQAKRFRKDTWVPSHAQVAAQLHFGCFYDYATNSVQEQKQVEPMPPLLRELAKRVAAKGQALGLCPATLSLDCATVVILEPGMHLPPSRLSGRFQQPAFLVVQAGHPTIAWGLDMECSPSGDISGAFDLALRRRSLVALSGITASVAEHGIPASAERAVVIMLRSMKPDLRAACQARGNAALN